MNQTQALAKLKKLIGPKLAYRVNNKAPNAERREELRAEALRSRDAMQAADAARQARLVAVLAADAEYQRLKAEHAEAKRIHEAVPSHSHKRIDVGRDNGIFFVIEADGDNWDEVVSIVEGKKQ